jgi:hypothetical protein
VPSPFMTPLPVPRAELGATRYLTRLGSECEVVFRTYVVSRLFYEADRGPRLAALPENRPRRNLVAPVCRTVVYQRFFESDRRGREPGAIQDEIDQARERIEPDDVRRVGDEVRQRV